MKGYDASDAAAKAGNVIEHAFDNVRLYTELTTHAGGDGATKIVQPPVMSAGLFLEFVQ